MTHHTPGPWVFGKDSEFRCIEDAGGNAIFYGDRDGALVCSEADGVLAAAAPDLLDVVKAATHRLKLYAGENEEFAGNHEKALIAAGLKAIAKAEGRS